MKFETIIKLPLITEKTNARISTNNEYTFLVDKAATKGLIRDAVEALFNVKVIDVRTLILHPKTKRSWVGKRNTYLSQTNKKAIVTLDKKNTIPLFTGGTK